MRPKLIITGPGTHAEVRKAFDRETDVKRKGYDISEFTRKQIQQVEDWINNYPRKILDFETAEDRFIRELVA